MDKMSDLLFIFEYPVLKAFSKGWNLGYRYYKLETDVNEFNEFNEMVEVNPVRDGIIKRSVDLSLDFRKVDPDDLSAIFKWVSI